MGVEPPVTVLAGRDPHPEFDAFYRRELPVQLRRATLVLGHPETARDLVHDAFVEVLRRWGQLEEPGAYLSVVVINRCRDHARREGRQASRVRLLLEDAAPAEESLWDALAVLPFNHRAAVVLRYYHQLPEREIADLLGCRPGSVGPWIQRGLRRLRKELS